MAYDSRHRSVFAMARRCSLFAALLALLALFGGADSWRAKSPCPAAVPCVVASDDAPMVIDDIAAIVALADDASSDGSLTASDEKAAKDAAGIARRLFATAAVVAATVPDRQRRTLFPLKRGPPHG